MSQYINAPQPQSTSASQQADNFALSNGASTVLDADIFNAEEMHASVEKIVSTEGIDSTLRHEDMASVNSATIAVSQPDSTTTTITNSIQLGENGDTITNQSNQAFQEDITLEQNHDAQHVLEPSITPSRPDNTGSMSDTGDNAALADAQARPVLSSGRGSGNSTDTTLNGQDDTTYEGDNTELDSNGDDITGTDISNDNPSSNTAPEVTDTETDGEEAIDTTTSPDIDIDVTLGGTTLEIDTDVTITPEGVQVDIPVDIHLTTEDLTSYDLPDITIDYTNDTELDVGDETVTITTGDITVEIDIPAQEVVDTTTDVIDEIADIRGHTVRDQLDLPDTTDNGITQSSQPLDQTLDTVEDEGNNDNNIIDLDIIADGEETSTTTVEEDNDIADIDIGLNAPSDSSDTPQQDEDIVDIDLTSTNEEVVAQSEGNPLGNPVAEAATSAEDNVSDAVQEAIIELQNSKETKAEEKEERKAEKTEEKKEKSDETLSDDEESLMETADASWDDLVSAENANDNDTEQSWLEQDDANSDDGEAIAMVEDNVLMEDAPTSMEDLDQAMDDVSDVISQGSLF